jgi:hypothetical protein
MFLMRNISVIRLIDDDDNVEGEMFERQVSLLSNNTNMDTYPVAALKYYTEEGDEYIDEYLEGGVVIDDPTSDDIGYLQRTIEQLDSAMTTAPDDITTVFRCEVEPPKFGYQPSFITVSPSLDVAKRNGDFILIIKVDPSVKMADCRKLFHKSCDKQLVLERGCEIQLVSMCSVDDRIYECIVTKRPSA